VAQEHGKHAVSRLIVQMVLLKHDALHCDVAHLICTIELFLELQ
jgi:hypothetical protein